MKIPLFSLLVGTVALGVAGLRAQPYAFVTVAGEAKQGGPDDGVGAAARLSRPGWLAADAEGNVFVTDDFSCTVRKITPTGRVTTVAGIYRIDGHVDGVGADARFRGPQGIGGDAAGNLYVADKGGTIRKITPSGLVSTFAGTDGAFGSVDGVGGAARFSIPTGVAVDGAGNVFVADDGNQTIRKITPEGVVSTFAGRAGSVGLVDGTGGDARFGSPRGLAVDARGNLYVSEAGNRDIRKITAAGEVTTLVKSPDLLQFGRGVGVDPTFYAPTALAVDRSGAVFVTDFGMQAVRRVAPDGSVETIAGNLANTGGRSADGTGGMAFFAAPWGVAVGPSGEVWVSDLAGVIRRGRPGATGAPLKIANVSAHGDLNSGAGTTVLGFTLTGAGSKSVLVRGAGPALGGFGIPGAATDPQLVVRGAAGAFIGANDDWGGGSALTSVFGRVGAFPFPATSKDAALEAQLGPGSYLAGVTADRGVTLAEVYDVSLDGALRFTNLSCLGRANETAAHGVTLGFVVTGESYQRLLVRAVGPGLSTFGVGDAASSVRVIAGGFGYGGVGVAGWDPALAGEFARAGAFPFAPGSRDAAVLVLVSAGSYSVQVAGPVGEAGLALVEVYWLP